MKRAARLVVQVGFLWLVFRVGGWVAETLPVPLPGNVVGMLLLFALLVSGVVKERWVGDAGGFLTRRLAFFFVPIAVGLMEWGGFFKQHGHWLVLGLVVSALVALAARGGAGAVAERCRPTAGDQAWTRQ
jgi:holin-like protein